MTLNWLEIFLSSLFSRGSLLEESVEQIRTLMKKTLEKNEDIAPNDLFRKRSFHPEALQDVHNFHQRWGGMCAFNPPHLMSCWFGSSEPISQRVPGQRCEITCWRINKTVRATETLRHPRLTATSIMHDLLVRSIAAEKGGLAPARRSFQVTGPAISVSAVGSRSRGPLCCLWAVIKDSH